MSAPVTPYGVVAALSALRSAFADIHVMHCCDEECAPDCDQQDESEAAYRHHDEHNFDVRERIHDRAEGLVAALHEWLGPLTDVDSVDEPSNDAAAVTNTEAGRFGARVAPLVLERDPDGYRRWWDAADRTEIAYLLEGLTDELLGVDSLHALMLSVFQADSGEVDWLRVRGLSDDVSVDWVNVDIDPSYDGDGTRDGANVVLHLMVTTAGQRRRWFTASVYVEHPLRYLAPQESDPCAALGEIVDHALASINDETADRDAFTATARTAMSAPSCAHAADEVQ